MCKEKTHFLAAVSFFPMLHTTVEPINPPLIESLSSSGHATGNDAVRSVSLHIPNAPVFLFPQDKFHLYFKNGNFNQRRSSIHTRGELTVI